MNEPQAAINTRALEMATQALTRIESHEQVCAERWKNVHSVLLGLKGSVDGLYSRWWIVSGSLIIVLIGIVGFLLARHGI